MFGRGNWSVLGINIDSLPAFEQALLNVELMYQVSQFAAGMTSKFQHCDTLGINPYDKPRLDDSIKERPQDLVAAQEFAKKDPEDQKKAFDAGTFVVEQYEEVVGTGAMFRLNRNLPQFGLWVVQNTYKDVSDMASQREQLAYDTISRPFKFLNKDEKKTIEQTVTAGSDAVVRKQFPVLLDFHTGLCYIQSTNKDQILAVRALLINLEVELFSMGWRFGSFDWPGKFLNKIYSITKYKDEFLKRADESNRFAPEEIEALEDKMLEKVVQKFFAMSEMESGLWIGLTTSAGVKLTDTAQSLVAASEPTDVTTLLQLSDKAELDGASIVVQELTTVVNKKGVERQLRVDKFALDVNTAMNLSEAGVALLRGFDLPGYRRSVFNEIKKTKTELPIHQYWTEWLIQMGQAVFIFQDNMNEVLELDKKANGLVAITESSEADTDEEE